MSITDEIKFLTQLATIFRRAMEETDFSDTQWLSGFPCESCDITSKMLGLFLYEKGFQGFTIMSGHRPDNNDGNHWWLELNQLVVDITADQFGASCQPPVIVATSSSWHSRLEGKPVHKIDDEFCQEIRMHHFAEFIREMYARVTLTIVNQSCNESTE